MLFITVGSIAIVLKNFEMGAPPLNEDRREFGNRLTRSESTDDAGYSETRATPAVKYLSCKYSGIISPEIPSPPPGSEPRTVARIFRVGTRGDRPLVPVRG
jgi:hypothetical protein